MNLFAIWLLSAVAQAGDPVPADPEAPAADAPAPAPAEAPPPAERPHRDDHFMGMGGDSLMVCYGGVYGMYVGGALGYAARPGDEGAIRTGAVLGGTAGGMTVYFLAKEGSGIDEPVLLGSGSTLGSFTGIQLARTFIPYGDEREYERIQLAGVLGSLGGTGLAVMRLDRPPPAGVTWRTDVGALMGWQMAAGAMDLAGYDPEMDRNVRAPVALGGAFAAGAGAYALGAWAGVKPGPDLMTLSLAHGGWIGLWSPFLFDDEPDAQQRWGGLRLGLGAGYVTALALAPISEPGVQSSTLQLVGAGAGNALGAGVPMAMGVDPAANPRAVVGPMLAAGVLGQVGAAAVGPMYEPSANDAAMLAAVGTWTTYQSIGWGYYGARAGAADTEAVGYALTTAGAGAVVGVALVPAVELSPAESTMMAAAGGWGTWYGGWGGHLAGMDPATHWMTTLSAGNVALVGTAVAVAGPTDPGWREVGLVNGMGLVGGATGALVGVVASPETDVIAAGSLVGSTAGLAYGVVLAAREPSAEAADVAQIPALHLGRTDWEPSLQVTPWMSDEGAPGAYVQLDLRER